MSTLKVNTLTDTAATKSVPIEDVVNGTARAWVNFNGASATSPFTIANGGIRSAYNVSSITDEGTGNYTVNFTNALADNTYTVVGSTSMKLGVNYNGAVSLHTNNSTAGEVVPTTTSCRVAIRNSGATAVDVEYFSVVVFR